MATSFDLFFQMISDFSDMDYAFPNVEHTAARSISMIKVLSILSVGLGLESRNQEKHVYVIVQVTSCNQSSEKIIIMFKLPLMYHKSCS